MLRFGFKEDKFKDALKKQSPELANAFDDYDTQLLKNADRVKQMMIKQGMDTSEMDYWADQLKKYS